MDLGILITAAIALIVGGVAGYAIFRYVIKGKYNEMITAADKEAEVIKEKKLLEVKEKFLNKKSELEKEVQQRNQRIQQSENKLKQREMSLNQRQEELGIPCRPTFKTRYLLLSADDILIQPCRHLIKPVEVWQNLEPL